MTIMQTANTQSIETRSSDSIVLFEREAGFRSSSSSRHSAYSFTIAEANAYTDDVVKYGSISHSISYHAETKRGIHDGLEARHWSSLINISTLTSTY